MGAQEEQMALVASSPMDHVSYILVLFSLAALVFLFANMLVHLYDRLANPDADAKNFANGYAPANGRAVEEGRVRDAEEFELEGLTSDDEADEGHGMLPRNEEGHSRPAGAAAART